ncbi:TPR-like protein [Acephala macrosclerotiorum]|nr:TPR-like protein [Acephala macrosclerotiorum]
MADPAVFAASIGLINVLRRCGSSIESVLETSGTLDEGILNLRHATDTLIAVNESIQGTYKAERNGVRGIPLADRGLVESLWQNVRTLLVDCQKTVEEVEEILLDFKGRGPTITSRYDYRAAGNSDDSRKTDKDFKKMHLRLVNYQNSLNHFLDAINTATEKAKPAPFNKHFYVPQAVSSIFTGREKLLANLEGYLGISDEPTTPTTTDKRFIIYGLGGSGKTQFCCKFAQKNRQKFWGIFFIDATSLNTAEHSFSKILKIAKIEASEGSNQRAAIDWLASLEFPWLLIIDNADSPSLPLETYFPESERGCILVTTRDPTKKIHGTVGSRFYHFERLESEDARELLLKAACRPLPWDDLSKECATSIASTLGFLPLALVQAGKAIMNNLCSLSNYPEHYHASWHRIRTSRKRSRSRSKADDDANMSVYSSYEINLKSLEESNDEEARDSLELLKMLSFFHCENTSLDFLIAAVLNPAAEREQAEKDKVEGDRMKLLARPKTWKEYFRERLFTIVEFATRDRGPTTLPAVLRVSPDSEAHFDEFRLRQALGRLSQMSLITHDDSANTYSMHPLVHTWVRERPEMIAEQALWCQAATTTLAQAILLPPHGSSEKEEDMRRNLLPHINHVRKCWAEITVKITENRKARKATWMSPLVSNFGRRQALEFAKFSRVYQECGLWKEAEELQVTARDFVCSRLGNDHPAAIAITLFLSGTYFAQSRTNEAAELQQQAYQACLRSLGPDHPRTLKVMDTLGSSKCFQGRFKESLELHEKAIAGMKATPLTKEEDLYIAMGNLGRILWRYFRYQEAKDAHEEALEGLERILGPTHLQTLIAMEDLAVSYLDCGEQYLDRAHELVSSVLSQRESRLGKEQPFTLLAICNLARVKSAMGQNIEAEALFRAAIPIAERTIGINHFGTLAGKVRFAQVLVKQERYDEAEEVFLKVVEKQRYASAARQDGDHPDRILALWYLVLCYELHGKLDDALARVDELDLVVATIGGEGLGKLHPFQKRLDAKREELECSKLKSAKSETGGLEDEVEDLPAMNGGLSMPTKSTPRDVIDPPPPATKCLTW